MVPFNNSPSSTASHTDRKMYCTRVPTLSQIARDMPCSRGASSTIRIRRPNSVHSTYSDLPKSVTMRSGHRLAVPRGGISPIS